MKKILTLFFAGAMITATFVACEKNKGNPPKDGQVFYYYGTEKIFLQQVKDKIYVKYAPESEPSTEIIENSGQSLEYFKARPEVISANYLLQDSGGHLIAIADGVVVKLKNANSYAQLQELAERNDCRLGAEDEFVESQYMLYVPKTSKRDALQMANLFYETGLFEFSEPDLIYIDAFD